MSVYSIPRLSDTNSALLAEPAVLLRIEDRLVA